MQKSLLVINLLVAAILFTLGFPNILGIYIPLAPVISFIILFKVLYRYEKLKIQIGLYFIYNLFITLISFYWIASTFQEFGNLPLPIALLLNALYTFIFNPHIWIFLILRKFISTKISFNQYPILFGLSPLLSSFFITTFEYWVPQQFPVMLGQPWIIFSEHLSLASVFGLPAYSFFSYLLIFSLILPKQNKKVKLLNFTTICLFIILNPILKKQSIQDHKEINLRLVQANISNFLKISSEQGRYASVQEVIQRYYELSIKPYQENKSLDLIVWPETAYPYAITTNQQNLTETVIPPVFQKISELTSAYTLFGGYDHTKDNEDGSLYKTDYNSAILLNPNAKINKIYHKQILIPFGETLPFGPLNKYISKYLEEIAFFEKGSDFTSFTVKGNIHFISSICYELIQPEYIREYLNKTATHPDFIINLTNDSWYGPTVEPEQHLFLAKWRAIEFNLPIVRSTNTGISTVVDKNGSEIERLSPFLTGNIDFTLRLPKKSSEITLYQKWGYFTFFALFTLLFLFQLILLKLKNENHS